MARPSPGCPRLLNRKKKSCSSLVWLLLLKASGKRESLQQSSKLRRATQSPHQGSLLRMQHVRNSLACAYNALHLQQIRCSTWQPPEPLTVSSCPLEGKVKEEHLGQSEMSPLAAETAPSTATASLIWTAMPFPASNFRQWNSSDPRSCCPIRAASLRKLFLRRSEQAGRERLAHSETKRKR